MTGGTVVLASAVLADPNPLILNRFLLRLRVDSEKQRIDVLQGDIGNMEVGLAVSGNLDYSTRRSAARARRGRPTACRSRR